MEMFDKKRLELIIESPAQKRAGRVLSEAGVTGYTVLPAMAGYGGTVQWTRGTDISASRDMVVFICIMDAGRLELVVERLGGLLGQHIGVLSVSDVKVVRKDLF